jgi:hypothetical protein
MKPSLQRRGTRLVLWAAALTAAASAVMGSSMATAATRSHDIPAVVPTATVVGTGLVTCKTVTGEVGFTPNLIAGGQGAVTTSIWFRGSDCGPGTRATKPVPKWVIGSMSFTMQNRCPVPNGLLGVGTLNLAYNYPDVASLLIDPSVGPKVTVTQPVPGIWVLRGPLIGSYPDTRFQLVLRVTAFAGQTCSPHGFISRYIPKEIGLLTV